MTDVELKKIGVDCSPYSGKLRIGIISEDGKGFDDWECREDEIVTAVRDFLVNVAIKADENEAHLVWDLPCEKITLSVKIEEVEK